MSYESIFGSGNYLLLQFSVSLIIFYDHSGVFLYLLKLFFRVL